MLANRSGQSNTGKVVPQERKIPYAVVPFTIIAGVLSLLYSLYGAVMSFFIIGSFSINGWGDIYGFVFELLPLLAFPLFLISLHSMKAGRNWFSVYFLVDFLFGSVIFFRGFALTLFFTIPRIAVILAVVLINAAYLLTKHVCGEKDAKIPGLISIMTR